jgi:hypothetical protein
MNPEVVIPFVEGRPIRVIPKIPSQEAVRKQLSTILQSRGFRHAGRMGRFLNFVVEKTLAGRCTELCEYSIGTSVYDRDESFEPGIDPIVRNEARRLRQKLVEYYQQLGCGGESEVVIDIPKGGYVPVFSFASCREGSNSGRQYRLTVSLIRIADNTEIWHSQHEY